MQPIILEFSPKLLSKEEIEKEVKKSINNFELGDTVNFGHVMKEAMKSLKGKADGALVSQVVREMLNP